MVVIVLAVVFFFADMPDIKMEDDYTLDDATSPRFHVHLVAPALFDGRCCSVSLCRGTGRHFQLLYQLHDLADPAHSRFLGGAWRRNSGWFETHRGSLGLSNKALPIWLLWDFFASSIWPLYGTVILKKISAHSLLGFYGAINVALCLVIFLKLGWVSVASRLSDLFLHVHHVPDHLCARHFWAWRAAKKASSFIVMAIMGGAILPKLMGAVADQYDLSRGLSCRCSASA